MVKALNNNFVISSLKAIGLATALKGIFSIAQKSVQAFAGFETVKTNLQIVTGSAEKAKEQFNELKELASATPFDVEGLASASVALQQVGVESKNVTQTLRMLGDVAGGSNDIFNRVVQNYAQILSVGQASAMDIRQFAQMGLPVYQMMKDMGIQGTVTADQITEMFKKMTSEGGKFFNGMSLQSETLNGKISTLKDTWKEYGATLAETTGLSDLWKKVTGSFTDFLQEQTDIMDEQQKMEELKAGYLNGEIIPSYEYLQKTIDNYTTSLKELGKDQAYINNIMNKFTVEGSLEDSYKKAKIELDSLQEQYDYQKKLLKIEEDRVKANEELVKKQKEQEDKYASIYSDVESQLAETTSGRIGELRKEIEGLQKLLDARGTVTYEYYTGPGMKPITSTYEKDVYDSDQKTDIRKLIKQKQKELNDLLRGEHIRDWFDVFNEVTGIDISSLRSLNKPGDKPGRIAGDIYASSVDESIKNTQKMAEVFGENLDFVDILKGQRDKIKSEVESLLSETGIDDPFKLEDDSIKKMIEKYQDLNEQIEKATKEQEELTKKQAREAYLKNLPKEKVSGLMQGSDVGNFVEGMQQGGVWGGILNTLLSALANVIGGLEGMNLILNPVTNMFQELAPTIKALLFPAAGLGKLMVYLGRGIQWVLNFLSVGAINYLSDRWDELSVTTETVNKNMGDLTKNLTELSEAIDKQEQYYLGEKMNLMAYNRYTTPVNDMILTPQGRFSTNPKDTIIATKNPSELSSNKINIQINNSQADNIDVDARQDNYGNIIIDISRKIAGDYARGTNGWDSAVGYRNQKQMGRRLS